PRSAAATPRLGWRKYPSRSSRGGLCRRCLMKRSATCQRPYHRLPLPGDFVQSEAAGRYGGIFPQRAAGRGVLHQMIERSCKGDDIAIGDKETVMAGLDHLARAIGT